MIAMPTRAACSRSRPAARPRWLASAIRAPMTAGEIGNVIRTLERQAPSWRPTAVAEVAAEQSDPFRVLIACLLSLRTQDATTRVAAERLAVERLGVVRHGEAPFRSEV